MNKKKSIISLIFNIAIIIITIVGLGVAVIDCQKQDVSYGLIFIYYTTLSNLFLCVSSMIIVVYESLLLKNKIKVIPTWVYIVKLCATTSIALTLGVVIFFLTPLFVLDGTKNVVAPLTLFSDSHFNLPDVSFLYTGSNLLFHIFNPILGILVFLLFENTKRIKFPFVCFSIIFTEIYELFYYSDIFLKWIPVSGQTTHDWYHFLVLVNDNQNLIPFLALAFVGITFLIGYLLWLGNNKIVCLENKKVATK